YVAGDRRRASVAGGDVEALGERRASTLPSQRMLARARTDDQEPHVFEGYPEMRLPIVGALAGESVPAPCGEDREGSPSDSRPPSVLGLLILGRAGGGAHGSGQAAGASDGLLALGTLGGLGQEAGGAAGGRDL